MPKNSKHGMNLKTTMFDHKPSGNQEDFDPYFEWKVWFYCSCLAASVPIIIPAVQFGYIYNIWSHYNKPVSREHCSCSCWDTVFKGKNFDLNFSAV